MQDDELVHITRPLNCFNGVVGRALHCYAGGPGFSPGPGGGKVLPRVLIADLVVVSRPGFYVMKGEAVTERTSHRPHMPRPLPSGCC